MAANAASVSRPVAQRLAGNGLFGVSPARLGYTVAGIATLLGWLVTREHQLVDPLRGVGYWLGIAGASLMAVLLLYPLRKRVRLLRFLGPIRYWFQMHMLFGVLGPILILYHCNFRLGSLNSNVALICTLLVAASGLVGRYLHSKLYADLEGHRRTLSELAGRAHLSEEQLKRTAKLAPDLGERMRRFDRHVLMAPAGFLGCLLRPAKLAVTTRVGYLGLAWRARREIRREADRLNIGREQRVRVQRAVTEMIRTHLRRVRRVAEFHSYERLFSLWHVFHLPFFYILIITALIHVLAVHMY